MAAIKDLPQRVLTALAGAAVFLFALFAHPGSLALAFGVIALFALWELARLTREDYRRPLYFPLLPALLLGFFLPLSFIFPELSGLRIAFFAIPAMMLFVLLLRDRGNRKAALVAIFGILWIGLPMAAMTDLGAGSGFRPLLVMGLLFLVWSNDVGAYFAGSLFGRHKLAPSISPNKSWEGVFGGMALGLIMAFALASMTAELSLPQWLMLALLCTLFGTLGDLAESRLKRAYHTKDSGGMLPGHGGFLDRFDSLFIVAPAAWLVLKFIF